jgi:hypothetical protein
VTIKAKSYVYCIGEDGGTFVKIGVSKKPMDRLKDLQIGNSRKLFLVAIIPGSFPEETALRYAWGHLHHHGEWHFDEGKEISNYFIKRQTMMTRMADVGDVPAVAMGVSGLHANAVERNPTLSAERDEQRKQMEASRSQERIDRKASEIDRRASGAWPVSPSYPTLASDKVASELIELIRAAGGELVVGSKNGLARRLGTSSGTMCRALNSLGGRATIEWYGEYGTSFKLKIVVSQPCQIVGATQPTPQPSGELPIQPILVHLQPAADHDQAVAYN